MKIIDTNFDFHADSHGRDPDVFSLTLKKYHKILWSKPLPNDKLFNLQDNKAGRYLYHKSELGEFILGSDAISHSYKNHKNKQWLTPKFPRQLTNFILQGAQLAPTSFSLIIKLMANKLSMVHVVVIAKLMTDLI